MSRYIDANELIDNINEWIDTVGYATIGKSLSYYGELIGCIEDTKTADVKPIVLGKWKHTTEPLGWEDVDCFECSVCGESWVVHEDFSFEEQIVDLNFCPHCGADMRGEKV